jgi:hypothetical protein
MEVAVRQLGHGSQTRRRLLILPGAAAVTAILFALLFAGMARLTAWIFSSGFERFSQLHPALHIWIVILPSIMSLPFCLVAGTVGYRRNVQRRARLQAQRRPRGW